MTFDALYCARVSFTRALTEKHGEHFTDENQLLPAPSTIFTARCFEVLGESSEQRWK